jgi:WD40 repeat protein
MDKALNPLHMFDTEGTAYSVCFIPDTPFVVFGSEGGYTYLANWETKTLITRKQHNTDNVRCIVALPQRGLIVSGSWDRSLCVLNPDDLNLHKRLAGWFLD